MRREGGGLLFSRRSQLKCGRASDLLLAHQADDWAETALKRVLEGAHLAFLGGMEPVGEGRACIWRPLLKVRRSEILRFIEGRQLNPIL